MKAIYLILYTLYVISTEKNVEAVNILVLDGVPSPSHHMWITKISVALAEKGYNVTSLSSDVDAVATPNLHFLHLDKLYETIMAEEEEVVSDLFEYGKKSAWSVISRITNTRDKMSKGMFLSTGWKQLLAYPDDFKFDLVINDFVAGPGLLTILPKFNYPPLIGATAYNDVSVPTGLVNGVLVSSISTNNLYRKVAETFLQRLDNYLLQCYDYALRQLSMYPQMDRFLRDEVKMTNLPSTAELSRRHKLVLINYDMTIDTAEQLPPNIIGVGGLQVKAGKKLPEDIETIMQSSKKGVILFSLGTNIPIDQLSSDKIVSLLKGFANFPDYTFLCKMSMDKFEIPVPDNVIIRKWLPQNDVLAHNRTKLFVTHSGLLSTQEAVWHSVPMLGFPTFFDQFMNMEKSIRKGIAEKVLWEDLTPEHLTEKLQRMLSDPSYEQNMREASAIFHDQPIPALERAVWWVEWILRHPNATHLQSSGHAFSFIQLHSIDVLFTIFAVLLLVLVILTKISLALLGLIGLTRKLAKNQRKPKRE